MAITNFFIVTAFLLRDHNEFSAAVGPFLQRNSLLCVLVLVFNLLSGPIGTTSAAQGVLEAEAALEPLAE